MATADVLFTRRAMGTRWTYVNPQGAKSGSRDPYDDNR